MASAERGSEFQVKLNGLKLPATVEKKIATEIRQTVMRELAGLDFKGDLKIGAGLKIGPEIWGFVLTRTL